MALEKLPDCGTPARVMLRRAAVLILLLSACAAGPRYGPDSPVVTIVVPVERLAHPPLLPKLPFTVGIHYPESIRTAGATLGGGDAPRCRYEFGAAAVSLFDQIAAVMFNRTVGLASIPNPEATAADVDIVLVPHFEPLLAMVFTSDAAPTTMVTGLKLQFDVLAPDGSGIAKIEARATSPIIPDQRKKSTLQPADPAAARLLREAVGEISVALAMSPEVARWAGTRRVAWQWPQEPSRNSAAEPPAGVTIVVCSRLYGCSANEGTVAVGKALRTLDPTVEIVAAEDLQRALYPVVGRTSFSDSQKSELLLSPAVAARAGTVNVRYLVVGEVLEQWTTKHGYAVFGYFAMGLLWNKSHESAWLRVFDFATATDTGGMKHRREALAGVMPIYGIPLPIPIPRMGDAMPEAIAKQLLPLIRPGR